MNEMLVELLSIGNLGSAEKIEEKDAFIKRFLEISLAINPENGESLANNLLSYFGDNVIEEFTSESLTQRYGYCISHWVSGGDGDEIQERLIRYLYALCPKIHAQSWGCGDDGPWEYWVKYEGEQLIRHDDEPFQGKDKVIQGTIYRWWHQDMPSDIQEGMLNWDNHDEYVCVDEGDEVSDDEYEEWLVNSFKRAVESEEREDIDQKESRLLEGKYSTDEVLEKLDEIEKMVRSPVWKIKFFIKRLLKGL